MSYGVAVTHKSGSETWRTQIESVLVELVETPGVGVGEVEEGHCVMTDLGSVFLWSDKEGKNETTHNVILVDIYISHMFGQSKPNFGYKSHIS